MALLFSDQQSVEALTGTKAALGPPLKWAGGKRWLVPILRLALQDIWQPDSTRLVEPFVGGMAVALGLQPRIALLNDLNPHLINFYTWLQKGLTIDIPLENNAQYYYVCRQRFNDLILRGQATSLEAAKLFYFMNRTGYNGLCRFNNNDQFNVPFGRYKTINYVKDFSSYVPVLKNFQFTAMDFAALPIHTNDVVYADPPYDVEFTKYSANDFKWQDQVRLAEWLSSHSGPVLASNQATERIVDLYRSLRFSIHFLDAPRRISCDGDRKPAKEILAYRNLG
ncbi:Dam family site-specific DNA-(adenine-N6)-methyltransferase [Leptolyngbya sp. NK1-12]|uniref:Site-specific DNA-methyltransferase (adenine-specific) n=1 Tax=Leptolyngbya sp. NK1-12 TaxID=2547451 RepID=A0AA97AG77_9CYAN|nr:Dam family site-specific DNA-(adenine-N6)-methyltransferase [Leptolyngbya sp. NK1-12]WNZ21526.1 Dam family site-specific DNA-(adenine-N6)-methyltransferase [Leptolyngbya sp. NK1-12]